MAKKKGDTKDIRKTHKHGASIEITLTGFADENKHYHIEKMMVRGKERIVLTEVK